MELKVFSIKDSKAEVFNHPFYKATHAEAERELDRLVKDEQSMVSKYPDDFDLYYLGTYDTCKGVFISNDTPQHILKANMLKQH